MSRIKIFAGHFGSGKTEIAINQALKMAEEGQKVAIVDLDIVNPYFCSRELKELFDEKGIRLISSNPDLVNVELMVVTGEINAVFNDKSYQVVIDIGGDDAGAIALGQYNRYLKEEDYEMYFVVNNNRLLTSDIDTTEEYLYEVERASRLKVTSFIANTNLSYETTIAHIEKGDKIVSELSEKLGIPYKYTGVREDLVSEVAGKVKGEIFPIKIYMKKPWEV